MDEYEIRDVSGVEIDLHEQLGSKEKFWFYDNDGKHLLFKSNKSTDKNGNVYIRQGEAWAEKVACELAKNLKIPCANYDLAVRDGVYGVVTPSVVPENGELIHGNQLLLELAADDGKFIFDRKEHTVPNAMEALNQLVRGKPLGWSSLPNIRSSQDVFIGYLMLDALIGNQDRHEDNWGVIKTNDGTYHLAHTFDHAASLGRNESDDKRIRMLETLDFNQSISSYASRAKSCMYDSNLFGPKIAPKRLKTIDAFMIAADYKKSAALTWCNNLSVLDYGTIRSILEAIPKVVMTDVAKRFTLEVIKANRVGILKRIDEFYE